MHGARAIIGHVTGIANRFNRGNDHVLQKKITHSAIVKILANQFLTASYMHVAIPVSSLDLSLFVCTCSRHSDL